MVGTLGALEFRVAGYAVFRTAGVGCGLVACLAVYGGETFTALWETEFVLGC